MNQKLELIKHKAEVNNLLSLWYSILNSHFSYFKQHYIYFNTLFHSHIFQKTTNNVTQTNLPNTPLKIETNLHSHILKAAYALLHKLAKIRL